MPPFPDSLGFLTTFLKLSTLCPALANFNRYKVLLSWTQTQKALVSLSLFRLPPDGRQDAQRTVLVFISDFNKNVPVLPSLFLLYLIRIRTWQGTRVSLTTYFHGFSPTQFCLPKTNQQIFTPLCSEVLLILGNSEGPSTQTVHLLSILSSALPNLVLHFITYYILFL